MVHLFYLFHFNHSLMLDDSSMVVASLHGLLYLGRKGFALSKAECGSPILTHSPHSPVLNDSSMLVASPLYIVSYLRFFYPFIPCSVWFIYLTTYPACTHSKCFFPNGCITTLLGVLSWLLHFLNLGWSVVHLFQLTSITHAEW